MRQVPTPEPGTDAGDEELRERELAQYLAVLRGADGRRRDLDESEYLVIGGARDSGATWGRIAEALGLGSPQAAQKRYEGLEKRVTEAHSEGRHCTLLRELAAAQRKNAGELREAITGACDAGVPWRAIGEALGIPHETAFRQFKAGSPIVVVRAYQSAPEAADDDGESEAAG